MIAFAPAKINIGLHVIAKRPDGFHNLETVFYPIDWCDVLEIIKADAFHFTPTGLIIDGNANDNLCIKAYQLLKQDFNLSPVHIYLHKLIPMGAGLGGGSSDAAHTLLLLNKIFNLNLSNSQLLNYATQLGSDCAFFLHSTPQLAKDKGEVLTPLSITLKNYFIVVVTLPIHINTAHAYANVKPKLPTVALEQLVTKPLEEWKNLVHNDFESSVFLNYPAISEIKKQLYLHGAVYASLSGSGASVYGVFKEEKNLTSAFSNCNVWQGQCRF